MNIVVFGAAGFIGTNLVLELASCFDNNIYAVDECKEYFSPIINQKLDNVEIIQEKFDKNMDFDNILSNKDVVYHLATTTTPAESNEHIVHDLYSNVIVTAQMLESCIRCNIKKVVFISSGGTVYGNECIYPIKEDSAMNPISSYGITKMTIEKLLFLYNYLYSIDYRIIRLANPYGPYQRPNTGLGVIADFTYKAIKHEPIFVYGDGTVIRDYIYIDDVITAIIKIAKGNSIYKIFNLGSGCGTSINQLLSIIKEILFVELNVTYTSRRRVDVPINYLDISRYEGEYGKLSFISLEEGISKTSSFLKKMYVI